LSAFVGTGKLNLSAAAAGTTALTAGSDGDVEYRTSAAAGVKIIYHYTPSNALKPGNYTVVEAQQPAGYFDGLLTARNVAPIPGSVGTHSIPITLPPGGVSANNNFAHLQPASLGGFVYYDKDNVGFKNGDAQPIPNTTVTLTGVNDLGSAVTQALQTDTLGAVSFAGLRPGQDHSTETHPAGLPQGPHQP